MKHIKGIILIEALVAMLIVALGMLGIIKLQGHLISSTGLAKARAEAIALAEDRMELLRSRLDEDELESGTDPDIEGTNATYDVAWTISDLTGPDQRFVDIDVSWTDSRDEAQVISLQGLIAWEDPASVARLDKDINQAPTVKPPTGLAERGDGAYPTGELPGDANDDGSGTTTHVREDGVTELIDSAGKVVLFLKPVNGISAQFVTIRGKIYLDFKKKVADKARNVSVRLSSEGQCFFDNTSLTAATGGNPDYFPYVCYVGPDWYGNVGIVVGGNGNAPKICVGTKATADNGTTTSTHASPGYNRTYRGFKAVNTTPISYRSTGVEGGSSYPPSGRPLLSDSESYQNDFVLSDSNKDCADVLGGFSLLANFGRNVCIDPHSDAAVEACPSIWPGYSSVCMPRITGGMFDDNGSVSIVSTDPEIVCNIGSSLGNRNFECLDNITQAGTSITVKNWFDSPDDPTLSYCYQKTVDHKCSTTEVDFQSETGRTACPAPTEEVSL